MVVVAQLVRATDCGSVGRGFEPRLPPKTENVSYKKRSFFIKNQSDFFYESS